jgi:rare lipoprotein A
MTATGETYNQHEFTAAHPSLPFDTYLKVKNRENGDSVIVRINDRGPYISDRSLDLSREAARCLNSEKAGILRFEAVIMQPSSAQSEQYFITN